MDYHSRDGTVFNILTCHVQPKDELEPSYWISKIYVEGSRVGVFPRPHFGNSNDAWQSAFEEVRNRKKDK